MILAELQIMDNEPKPYSILVNEDGKMFLRYHDSELLYTTGEALPEPEFSLVKDALQFNINNPDYIVELPDNN